MIVLIKSINIFLLGIYAEAYKHLFDRTVDRQIRKGRSFAGKRITKMSNKSYRLYTLFREYEKDLIHLISIKQASKFKS